MGKEKENDRSPLITETETNGSNDLNQTNVTKKSVEYERHKSLYVIYTFYFLLNAAYAMGFSSVWPYLQAVESINGPSYGSYVSSLNSTRSENPKRQKGRLLSLRLMYFLGFLSAVGYSMCFSSVWPFLQEIDPTSTTSFLGWVIASYSIAQFVGSFFFGIWADKTKNHKIPVISGTILTIAGGIVYGYVQNFPAPEKMYLIVARSLMGFGAGSFAAVRSYASQASYVTERTAVIATIGMSQALGFIIGPVIQTAFVPLKFPGPVESDYLHLNMYTAPAFFAAICGIVTAVMLVVSFKEFNVQEEEAKTGNTQSDDEGSIDWVAWVVTLMSFFVSMLVFTQFETIMTPLSMNMFDWTGTQATLYNGIILAGVSVISTSVSIAIRFVSNIFSDRQIIVFGFTCVLIGYIGISPWGTVLPDIKPADISPDAISNFTTILPFSNMTTAFAQNLTVEQVGCPSNYSWCYIIPKILLWQYLLASVVMVLGYATVAVVIGSLYSKILGPRPQGAMMGFLVGSGCTARAIGPIAVSNLYQIYGPRVNFLGSAAIVFVMIVIIGATFKRLVPYNTRNRVDLSSSEA